MSVILAILSLLAILSIRFALGLENVRLKSLRSRQDAALALLNAQELDSGERDRGRQQLRLFLLERRRFRHASQAEKGFVLSATAAFLCLGCVWMDILTNPEQPGSFWFFPDLAAATGMQITVRILLVIYCLKLAVTLLATGRRIHPLFLAGPLLFLPVLPVASQCISLSLFCFWAGDELWLLLALMVQKVLLAVSRPR